MRESDIDLLYRLLSDAKVMKYIEPPFTKEKTDVFLKNTGIIEQPLIYAVEKEGCFIGYVIYHDYDEDSMEIGWVLSPVYWGNGYASSLTEQLIDKAISAGKQMVIECAPEQTASKKIALKFGFEYEGCFNGLDVYRRKA